MYTYKDTNLSCYGNIGCEEFKGGTKNQKGSVPNMTIFQEKMQHGLSGLGKI